MTTVTGRLILVGGSREDAGAYYCQVHNSLNDLAHTVASHQVNISVTGETSCQPHLLMYVYRAYLQLPDMLCSYCVIQEIFVGHISNPEKF